MLISFYLHEVLTDLCNRPGSLTDFQPVLGRSLGFGSEDFNSVAGFQTVFKWYHLTVHFCSDGLMPNLGMDDVRKIQRSSSITKFFHLPRRSKNKDPSNIEIILHHIHE